MLKLTAGLASRSLKARLLIASFILLPMIIGVAGYALQNSFAYSLQASLEKRLRLQVYLMIGSAEMQDGKLVIGEGQQLRLGSDTYGYIHTHLGLLQWASANTDELSTTVKGSIVASRVRIGETYFLYFEEDNLYLYQYPLQWDDGVMARRYLFSIVESGAEMTAELNAYRTQLWGWLFAVTVLALMLQTLITRWGLKPLSALVDDLHNIERGYSTRLEGYYPEEVQGVTDSLNHLLHSERNQRERYRNTLGDLAHSLKTPLAVIRGAGNEQLLYEGYRNVVDEQVRRMDQIVQYQLARAVRSQANTIAHATPLAPIIKRISTALSKVYREKNVDVSLLLDETALFGADERDMMELLGNMLENAFKYGHSAVRISLIKEPEWVQLNIEDDGPGVSPDMRHVILQRGARVDTSAAPGQGIGLTVAVDILSSYDGQLEVGESSLGGARFKVILPTG
ncbi:ATP-binding protein [Neptunomonas japonica]|uniref:histidine kinase n=1 Tax=Neptunomonas japonica JAMM 1380 TaxID=1441457 RepID=A0A7R6PET2_9GAMM|nr:ATP-binding protein [Neptunomonas japonica]BBB28208.1 two-component system, OmpR family, sensor histidine kinase PhoQ [Neptunomonas japonica JAMM 1380]